MEDEQRLKDMLRAIEAQETVEDLGDPEEYDDMGGIKSLDRGAPSIKLASETGPEELELELMSVIREFNDKMQNGELDPSITVDEYINDYLSRKKMMEDKRAMAAYGGRMQYADGKSVKDLNVYDVVDKDKEDEYYKIKEEQMLRKYYPEDYPPSQRTMGMEDLRKMIKKAEQDKKKLAKGGIAGVL